MKNKEQIYSRNYKKIVKRWALQTSRERIYTLRNKKGEREHLHVSAAKPLCTPLHARSHTHSSTRPESRGTSSSGKLPVVQTHREEPSSGHYAPSLAISGEYASLPSRRQNKDVNLKLKLISLLSEQMYAICETKIKDRGGHSALTFAR